MHTKLMVWYLSVVKSAGKDSVSIIKGGGQAVLLGELQAKSANKACPPH